MTSKKFLRIFALLAALFVVIRVIFFRQLSGTPLFDILILDSEFYHHWARSLAAGDGHPPGPFWLSPLYPMWMASLFAATGGSSAQAVALAQMLLSLGTLILLTLLARRLFGDGAALGTAALAAVCAPWLYYDGVLLSASLILFLNTAMLFLLLTRTDLVAGQADPSVAPRSAPFPRHTVWIVIGVLMGLSALARPSILLFALLLVIWQLRSARVGGFRFEPSELVRPAVLLAAIALTLAPVLIRNWTLAGVPVLTTSSGGVNFFIGNRAGASGMYDEFDFIRSFDAWREAEGFRAEASVRSGRDLSLPEASRYWMGQALNDIAVDPFDWMVLLFKKVWLTAQREEIPNNLSFRGVAGFAPILGSLPLRWALLFPLAAAGFLLILRRRHPARTLLLLYALAYFLANVIFFSSSEYRFPLLAVLLPAAGYFLASVWTLLEEKRVRELLVVCGLYLLVLVVVNVPSREVLQAVRPRADYYNLATVAVDYNRIAESIPLYARSLAVDPGYQEARIGLASSLWRLGNFDDARREFAMAGVAPPDTLSGQPLDLFMEQLTHIREEESVEEALAYIDAVFPREERAPAEVWQVRARYESELRRYDQAVESLLKGAEQEPDNPEWYYHAGRTAALAGDSTRAAELHTRAIDIYAAYAPARIELGFRAVRDRDPDTAATQLYELRRIVIPDDSTRRRVEHLASSIDSLKQAIAKDQNF